MITKVNDIDLKMLALFTRSYEKEYYIREAKRHLNVSSRTALNTLEKLEQKGILTSTLRGKIKLYAIRKTTLTKEYFILAEQYKKIQFLEKHLVIKEILERIEEQMQGIVIIFGSYAKGIQKKESDLDLFIAGKCDKKEIKQIGRKYSINIDIKQYPLDFFEKEIRNDILLNEIREHHVVVKDVEGFVQRVVTWNK